MLNELIKELNQLAIKEQYIYRFVNMLDSIVFAVKNDDARVLKTLTKNAESLLDEYRNETF